MIFSFVFFLVIFVLIGTLSALKNKHTNLDYMLAGHSVKPWLVALSAVATNNSGYMFIGMIGYTYNVGISSIWLMIGWLLGDFIASFLIHKRLRKTTEARKSLSFVSSLGKWDGVDKRYFRFIGGIITIAFLGTYAAAQLTAGSKALNVLFGWDYSVGAIIGAVMVLLYCYAGGIRASIWTDAAQSFVMVAAMSLLFGISISTMGGFAAFKETLFNVSPTYMTLFPGTWLFGAILGPMLFVISWVFAGFAVVGQPHIMVRFMSMDTTAHMGRVRVYYYSWYTLFFILTIGTGLCARVLLPESSIFDAELALPNLAQLQLPSVLVGLILAGLFAATMSTADSQILCCTASITHDMRSDHQTELPYILTKLATAFVTLVALCIALWGNKNVLSLVLIAWSALGSAFAPILIVYCFGARPKESLLIAMMIGGVGCMLLWRHLGLTAAVYEVAPGMVAGLLTYGVAKLFRVSEQGKNLNI